MQSNDVINGYFDEGHPEPIPVADLKKLNQKFSILQCTLFRKNQAQQLKFEQCLTFQLNR